MDFLKPKPIRRQKCERAKPNDYKKSIFEEIRNLCLRPTPIVLPIDDVKSIFDDIRSLCRIPELLTPIEDFNENQIQPDIQQTKPNKRRITSKLYYRDSDHQIPNQLNSFDNINQSKLFCAVVKGNQDINHQSVNSKYIKTGNHKPTTAKTSIKTSNHKPTTAKTCIKTTSLCRPKPLLSIDCDLSAKINQYSKQYSKPKLKKKSTTRKTGSKSSEAADNDFSDLSIASPSTSVLYSLPATPISSSDSSVNSSNFTVESNTTQSLIRRLRNAINGINPNYESYRQHFQQEITSKSNKRRRVAIDKSLRILKVLEWKANPITSGNTTPIHNIEYLETPPGSPSNHSSPQSPSNHDSIDHQLSAMINSLENSHYTDSNLTDHMLSEFNTFLSDLYSDVPIT